MSAPVQGESSEEFTPAVFGKSTAPVGAGLGHGEGPQGVRGESDHGPGVYAVSHGNFAAVRAFASNGIGIHAGGAKGAILAESGDGQIPAITANNLGSGAPDQLGGGLAARFNGSISVSHDIRVTGDVLLDGADYAEELTTADVAVHPGMVVVLDENGCIRPCTEEYDSRVAGVVAGANGVKSALVLDRHDGGAAIALMGKVWVLADATAVPIKCGDLLTSSNTPGHARVVTDRQLAFGALIGKAITDLPSGRGLVRALVNAS